VKRFCGQITANERCVTLRAVMVPSFAALACIAARLSVDWGAWGVAYPRKILRPDANSGATQVIRMALFIMGKRLAASAALMPLAILATACSDNKETAGAAKTETAATPAAEPAKPATPEAAKPAAGATAEAAKPAAAPVKIREAEGSVDVAKLLQPGPLPEMVLGKPDAPVTIVEYMSMTCPHCANFHANTLPGIKSKYLDTGRARLIVREFPFDPLSSGAFMLARCSKENYFPMVDVLFKQQQTWAGSQKPSDELLKIAKLAGFTQESFEACLTDDKLLQDLTAVKERGQNEFGVQSTPTFFINGTKYAGDMPVEEMSAIIDAIK
jgi:protein-disulfide isomerase